MERERQQNDSLAADSYSWWGLTKSRSAVIIPHISPPRRVIGGAPPRACSQQHDSRQVRTGQVRTGRAPPR